jgi:hypothetical protein
MKASRSAESDDASRRGNRNGARAFQASGDDDARWRAYMNVVTDPAQIVPPEPARQ